MKKPSFGTNVQWKTFENISRYNLKNWKALCLEDVLLLFCCYYLTDFSQERIGFISARSVSAHTTPVVHYRLSERKIIHNKEFVLISISQFSYSVYSVLEKICNLMMYNITHIKHAVYNRYKYYDNIVFFIFVEYNNRKHALDLCCNIFHSRLYQIIRKASKRNYWVLIFLNSIHIVPSDSFINVFH